MATVKRSGLQTFDFVASGYALMVPPSGAPDGLDWYSGPDGRVWFYGELAGRRRLISSDTAESLVSMAREMEAGRA